MNLTARQDDFLQWTTYAISSIEALLFLLAFTNLFVLAMIIRSSHLRNNPTNIYIASLCVADSL